MNNKLSSELCMRKNKFSKIIFSVQMIMLLLISFKSTAILQNRDIITYDKPQSFTFNLEDQDMFVITFHLPNKSYFGLRIQITEGGSFTSNLNIQYQSMDDTNPVDFNLQNQGNRCIIITNQEEPGSHTYTITNFGRFMGGDQLSTQAIAIISNNQTFVDDGLTCPSVSAPVIDDTFVPRVIFIGAVTLILVLVYFYISRKS